MATLTEGSVADIRKKRAVVRRKRNGVSRKISKLRHEGKSQDQAVAIALEMKRRGRLGPRGGYKRQ